MMSLQVVKATVQKKKKIRTSIVKHLFDVDVRIFLWGLEEEVAVVSDVGLEIEVSHEVANRLQ